MTALDIEVRTDWITRKLTINGVEYEETGVKGVCRNIIEAHLKGHYPDISDDDLELVEQALCSDQDDAQDALQALEDFFETF